MSKYFETLSPEAIKAHDRQREIPTPARDELIRLLVERTGRDRPCLDAGAGTGAIAIPLPAAGVPVIAADLSPAMLRELRARQDPADRFPLVIADITALPFRDATFGSVHLAHTLHLVEDWQRALSELVRVTNPGGALLFALGLDPNAHPAIGEIGRVFATFLPPPDAPTSPDAEIADFLMMMDSLGTIREPDVTVSYTNTTSPSQEIDRLRHNVFSRAARMDDDVLANAADRTRQWAGPRFGSLDAPIVRHRTLTYHVFRRIDDRCPGILSSLSNPTCHMDRPPSDAHLHCHPEVSKDPGSCVAREAPWPAGSIRRATRWWTLSFVMMPDSGPGWPRLVRCASRVDPSLRSG